MSVVQLIVSFLLGGIIGWFFFYRPIYQVKELTSCGRLDDDWQPPAAGTQVLCKAAGAKTFLLGEVSQQQYSYHLRLIAINLVIPGRKVRLAYEPEEVFLLDQFPQYRSL